MGLISRVSSRTYRKFQQNFHQKNIRNKNGQTKLRRHQSISTIPKGSLPSPFSPPKNCEPNTTSDPCPSPLTTKSKSSEVNSRVNKLEKSSPFTERSTLFTSNESNEKRLLDNLSTSV